MKTLAIIPARGGSKSIPRKNVKLIAGRPLIAWTIGAALAAKRVSRVVVSTDDEEIATVARRYGAEVVMRPAEISGDRSGSELALLNVLESLEAKEGYRPDVMAFLQCTSPTMTGAMIDGTVARVCDEGFDTAFTAVPFHYFIWSERKPDGWVGVNHVSTKRLMRQERTPEWQEVGMCYAMKTDGFCQHRFRFFGKIGMHEIARMDALELDDPEDWILAEKILETRAAKSAPAMADAERLKRVKLVVTDFDGVLTDNKVMTDDAGRESVNCTRADGWAVRMLRERGLDVMCISTETSAVVQRRCEKMGIKAISGSADKHAALAGVLRERNLAWADVAYIGNDTNDKTCLEAAGVAVVPADAFPEVLGIAHLRTRAVGGQGVLRELASLILASHGENK